MSTTATIRLYDMLRVKLGEQEARIFVQNFEEGIDEAFEQKKDLLVTKSDMSDLKLELKDEIAKLRNEMHDMRFSLLKWMLGFWIGQVIAISGLLIAIAKGAFH